MRSCLAQVELAVLELGDVDRNLLGVFLGNLLDLGKLLSDVLIGQNLLVQKLSHITVFVKMIYYGLFDLVDDRHPDFGVAKLVLGLAFEHRCLDLDCNGSDNALTDILRCPGGLFEELLDACKDSFLECSLVGSSVACILSVDV